MTNNLDASLLGPAGPMFFFPAVRSLSITVWSECICAGTMRIQCELLSDPVMKSMRLKILEM